MKHLFGRSVERDQQLLDLRAKRAKLIGEILARIDKVGRCEMVLSDLLSFFVPERDRSEPVTLETMASRLVNGLEPVPDLRIEIQVEMFAESAGLEFGVNQDTLRAVFTKPGHRPETVKARRNKRRRDER